MTGPPTTTTRWVDAARLGDVPDGWFLTVQLATGPVVLARRGADVHAMVGRCGHAGADLGDGRLEDACLVRCPWHGASFDVRDGTVVDGPARKPQGTYAVRVVDGTIQVDIP